MKVWKLGAVTVMCFAMFCTALASSTSDVTLRQLVQESQTIVLGKVQALHAAHRRSTLGRDMYYADICIKANVRGTAKQLAVLFAPMLSDEPDLVVGNEYLLFLVRSNQVSDTEIQGTRLQVYEVNRFNRGALRVNYGKAFTGPVSGEPDQQDVCPLLRRIAAISGIEAEICTSEDP